MTEYKQKFSAQASKTSLVKIMGYRDRNFEGTIQNTYYQRPKDFANLTQLILDIERSLDNLQYPQRGMEPRSFSGESLPGQRKAEAKLVADGSPLKLPTLEGSEEGILATFKINLLFRQNASWQGNVIWIDAGVEAQFRSVLELVYLMDSVLIQ